MKCPVCDQENPSMLCPRCGFDSSRDYEKYPTLGVIPTVSARRRQWQEQSAAPVPRETPASPAQTGRTRKKSLWLSIAACAVMLAVGFAAGFFLGKGTPAPTEPEISVQAPPETTEPAPTESIWEANVLRNDLTYIPDLYNANTYSVFGSNYTRGQIDSIVFLHTLQSAPADAWDVSAAGNGSVLAWVMPVGDLYRLYLAGEGGINAGATCRNLFAGYTNLRWISFAGNFHTDFSRDMGYMFYDCNALTALDLGSFNTANVRDMCSMFYDCSALTSLDLGSFRTGNVWDMSYMFKQCRTLTSLDLGSFDTTNVWDTTYMFYNCPAGSNWEHILK